MNLLALYISTGGGAGGLIVSLLVAGLLIWLIFYVLPLPQIAVVLVLMLLPGCSAAQAYQSTVASRTLAGGYSKDSGTIGVSDTVTYR